MSLTTLFQVKDWLDITSSDYDSMLESLIDVSTEIIESYCKRSFASTQTHIQWWSIWDTITDTVRCEYVPIVNFLSLSDDDDVIDPDDYFVDSESGLVRLYDSYFTKGVATVCASYVHGYSSVPADIELAARMLTSHLFTSRKTQRLGNVESAKLGDFSVRLSESFFPPEIRSILSRYRCPISR